MQDHCAAVSRALMICGGLLPGLIATSALRAWRQLPALRGASGRQRPCAAAQQPRRQRASETSPPCSGSSTQKHHMKRCRRHTKSPSAAQISASVTCSANRCKDHCVTTQNAQPVAWEQGAGCGHLEQCDSTGDVWQVPLRQRQPQLLGQLRRRPRPAVDGGREGDTPQQGPRAPAQGGGVRPSRKVLVLIVRR